MTKSRSICIQCGATNVGIQTRCLLCGTVLPLAENVPAPNANRQATSSTPRPSEPTFPGVQPPDVPR